MRKDLIQLITQYRDERMEKDELNRKEELLRALCALLSKWGIAKLEDRVEIATTLIRELGGIRINYGPDLLMESFSYNGGYDCKGLTALISLFSDGSMSGDR